ncbi:PREDICTED: serine/arginine repetitive matrix protein 1-like [Erythranthe guttata]|uniref:serine/arginine repetitive matrix protein 1-like n=1 Tax=Erythranthe guttata TaxID=4155 RepID=UPI00064DC934|nr:PREDICTED: serine/arginine repetitive matrix protein 1-like [Erythranthe guttata]|eukprot:XP_012845631.1 PREDICTED: serine/arginine repetitive matrix protein 1-like [Erythranthe guttata]
MVDGSQAWQFIDRRIINRNKKSGRKLFGPKNKNTSWNNNNNDGVETQIDKSSNHPGTKRIERKPEYTTKKDDQLLKDRTKSPSQNKFELLQNFENQNNNGETDEIEEDDEQYTRGKGAWENNHYSQMGGDSYPIDKKQQKTNEEYSKSPLGNTKENSNTQVLMFPEGATFQNPNSDDVTQHASSTVLPTNLKNDDLYSMQGDLIFPHPSTPHTPLQQPSLHNDSQHSPLISTTPAPLPTNHSATSSPSPGHGKSPSDRGEWLPDLSSDPTYPPGFEPVFEFQSNPTSSFSPPPKPKSRTTRSSTRPPPKSQPNDNGGSPHLCDPTLPPESSLLCKPTFNSKDVGGSGTRKRAIRQGKRVSVPNDPTPTKQSKRPGAIHDLVVEPKRQFHADSRHDRVLVPNLQPSTHPNENPFME